MDTWTFHLVVRENPNQARTNPTRTRVLPRRIEQNANPTVKLWKNPNLLSKNQTEPEPKCRGSYSVLSLQNEAVDTFAHFTVNEEFYFTLVNQVQVPAN